MSVTAGREPAMLDALLTNLVTGLRLALPLRTDPAAVHPGVVQIALLVSLLLSLVVAADTLSIPAPRIFVGHALAYHATRMLLLAAVAWALVGLAAPRADLNRVLTLVSAGLVLPVLAYAVSTRYPLDAQLPARLRGTGKLLWTLWVSAIVVRACATAIPLSTPRRPLLLAAILALPPALFVVPLWPIWYPYDGGYAEGDQPRLDVEATYYQQPALLQRALRELRPQRPGITDAFVVGFAGYADQRVFMNEVNYVTNLLEARFDAGGRVLRLVNHPDVVDRVPLANLHNLGVVLEAVGARMDTDEDILLLYMTSHASEEGEFAVQFWPLGLNDITPGQLAAALDRTGIRWRILILSGCYTGQFIDALEDPYTLLITASDYDSPSFGCADDRELTWFGEAFFHHAMVEQGETSLEQAFYLARSWIDARETEQDLPPSSPQLRLGAAMAEKLREWSRAVTAD